MCSFFGEGLSSLICRALPAIVGLFVFGKGPWFKQQRLMLGKVSQEEIVYILKD